jgi:phage FluMu gp28-like protein
MKPAAAAVQESAAPPVLLAYQRKWVADTSVVKVWRKSRRIGASWCDASEKALFSAAEIRPGLALHRLFGGHDA